MLAKSILAFAAFAVSAQAAAGSGPACLLAAMESSKNPSDWKSNCGMEKDTITSAMKQYCGDDMDAAMNQFTAICKSAGAAVSSSSSSSSGSMSMTSSAAMPTGSGIGYGPGSHFGSGPNGTVSTFTLYDSACSCMKTTTMTMSSGASSTGFVPYPTGGAPYPAGNGTAGAGATATGGYTAPTQPPVTAGANSGAGSTSGSASPTGGVTANSAAAKQVSFVAAVLAAGAAALVL